MATTDAVRTIVEPLAAQAGADVYDVTFAGGTLRVAVSRPGGIDLETLSSISRDLGQQLDDGEVVGGSYTLEVTSPGLERPLRTPEHYRGAVGESVTVRTLPDVEGERRIRGTIVSADEDTVTIRVEGGDEERTLRYEDVERARTTFSWGSADKPGGKKKPGGKSGGAKKPRGDQPHHDSKRARS